MGGDQKVIWTAPTGPFVDQGAHDSSRGAFGGPVPVDAGYGAAAGPAGYGAAAALDTKDVKKDKKDDSNKKMMMGAAGGLAVGAIGGALIANAMGMSRISLSNNH
jgi:hypothetical protein